MPMMAVCYNVLLRADSMIDSYLVDSGGVRLHGLSTFLDRRGRVLGKGRGAQAKRRNRSQRQHDLIHGVLLKCRANKGLFAYAIT